MTEQVAYGDFSRTMHQQVGKTSLPGTASFEVSHRCSLNCIHCYNNLPMNDTAARRRELTYDDYRRLLDEAAEAGSLWVLFTGGEIFVRPDFLKIYTYAKQKGFLITLFTNATLISPKIADYLAEWPPFSIEVTVYGSTKETYEKVTRVPGSYDRCISGIKLLRERGLVVKLKAIALSVSKHEVFAIQDLAGDLGCEFRSYDGLLNPRIDCSQSPLEFRLTPEEVVELDMMDATRWGLFRQKFEEVLAAGVYPTDEVYSCGAGKQAFLVNPEGQMALCAMSQQDKFDLRSGSLATGWNDFLRPVRARKVTRPKRCDTCHLRMACDNCPAVSELENGHAEVPVDFLCQVTHLRAYTLGLDVPANPAGSFTRGGTNFAEVTQKAEVLRKKLKNDTFSVPKRRTLPILQPSPKPGGGCGTCSL